MNNRMIGLALVAAGAVLGYLAWQEYNSFGSSLHSAFNNTPKKEVLIYAGGALALILTGGFLVKK
ncbi:MAG: DUF3185 family protein [Deltaproteobacteria bacterium]|nr:DUF3185 family protein [Deltaproteobacteria bacterium]